VTYFEVLSRNSLGVTEESHEHLQSNLYPHRDLKLKSSEHKLECRVTGLLDFFHRPLFLGVEEHDVSETGSVSVLR
jgi:hypothetical protein